MKERQSGDKKIYRGSRSALMAALALSYVSFSFTAIVSAATTSTAKNLQSTTTATKPEEKKTSSLSTYVELEYSTNNYKTGDVQKQTTLGIVLFPQYVLSESTSFNLLQIVSQEQTGPRNSSASNTTIMARYKSLTWGTRGDLRHELSGIAPVNQVSKDRDKFQGGVRIGTGAQQAWGFFFVKYLFSATRNFHEFTVNREGSPNLQYSLSNRLDLEFAITESLKLSLVGALRTGFTYRNFQRSNYLVETRIDYSVTENAGIFAGVSTDAPVMKANGRESNIQYFDEDRGQVQAGMNLTF